MKNEFNVKQSIYMSVKNKAENLMNNPAFIYNEKTFSHAHLIQRINQFAFALKEIGVKKDDVVTLCLSNIPDATYLLYAVNQLGAIANITSNISYELMKENLKKNKSKYLFSLDNKFHVFQELVFDGYNVHFCSPVSELPLGKRMKYKSISRKYGKIPPEYTMLGFYNAPSFENVDERFDVDAIYLKDTKLTSSKFNSLALKEKGNEFLTLSSEQFFESKELLTKIHSALVKASNNTKEIK